MMTALGKTEPGSERATLAAELEKALLLHMEIEEQVIYPVVADELGAEDEQEAEIEHGLARDGLANVMSLVEQPGFGAAVEMLKGGIMHHVSEEESEMFPSLKAAISREDWLALGDAVAKAKADAGAPFSTSDRRRSSTRKAAPKK
jgi:hypothetical protein